MQPRAADCDAVLGEGVTAARARRGFRDDRGGRVFAQGWKGDGAEALVTASIGQEPD